MVAKEDVINYFKGRGDDYARGRALALSFKPLTIEDVKEAYIQGIEDVFNATKQAENTLDNKNYYIMKEEDGFIRTLYNCKTVKGLTKYLPEELTFDHLVILLNKGMGAVRYEVDDNIVYHILTVEKGNKS